MEQVAVVRCEANELEDSVNAKLRELGEDCEIIRVNQIHIPRYASGTFLVVTIFYRKTLSGRRCL